MLTVLHEKLGEAHGLAMAASVVVDEVAERVLLPELRRTLRAMQDEAAEARARCLEVERDFGHELATDILAHANTTKEKAADLAGAWFKAGTGPIEAWSFLAMGEAGEVAVWTVLAVLAAQDGADGVQGLAEWGLPVQQRHLEAALEGVARLAADADPGGERWG